LANTVRIGPPADCPKRFEAEARHNNRLQRTALRAAAEPECSAANDLKERLTSLGGVGVSHMNPQAAFNMAVSRFNGRNLYDLWSISCLLSCIEYFDSLEGKLNFLHPMLYAEKVASFDRAIIDSKAAAYKQKLLTSQELPNIFNSLSEATAARTIFLEGSDDRLAKIRRLLSTMAHQQIRLHESLLINRLGRTFAMLHEIPNQYCDELRAKQGERYFDLSAVMQAQFGISVVEFFMIGISIMTLIRRRYTANIAISDELRDYTSRQDTIGVYRRAEILGRLIDESRVGRENFSFTASDLVLAELPSQKIEKVQSFINLVARTTKELRDIAHQQPVYSKGLIPDRLNPLERYPIVRLDGDRFIVPNLRYFDGAVTDLLHHIIQERHPANEYNQLRGYIQEIYFRLYIEDRLPHVRLISEVSYRKSKNRVEGPDLTLVETDRGKLIAIESKAKRVRVVSRVYPGDNYLLEDLQGAISALEKLQSKIQDLYANLPEYDAYQPLIDKTRQSDPIAVVVLGEGVFFLHEFLNDYLRTNPEHPLNQYTGPYCLMRIEAFEDAVEAAANNNMSLYDLLYEYWVRSKSTNINEPSAENFRKYPLKERTFTQKLADKFNSEHIQPWGNRLTFTTGDPT
jgi:hypothetical protein